MIGSKYYRMKSGMKQFEAAVAIGIHPSRLSKAEQGWLKLRDEEKKALSKLYQCEPDDLEQPKILFV